MIPLTLITGFLGSGKTTLLQRVIDRHRNRRIVYIVNDFGEVDVDGQRLELPADRLVSIPGGSVFCRCRAGELVDALRKIPAAGDGSGGLPDGVILEASGIADPRVIGQLLVDARLDDVYELRQAVTVVDPGSFLKLIHTLPNIIAQVETCHLAIINKIDLYEEAQIAETQRELHRINPSAAIVRARYCAVEVDPFGLPPPRVVRGDYAECADPHYVTVTVAVDRPVDARRLREELECLWGDVYRIKGCVPTSEGRLHVDLSPAGVSLQPAGRDHSPGHLVVIAAPSSQPRVDAFAGWLKAEHSP